MKKVFAFVLVFVSISCLWAAEKKSAYVVQNVSGKVTYEVSNGEWAEVKTGMRLDSEVTVNTALNSTLTVVSTNSARMTVKPMKKGKLNELVAANTSRAGVKIGSRVTKEDIAAAALNTSKGVNTASSRASEAKADVEWEE